MKILLPLLLIASSVMAQESPLLSIPGMTQAVATYAKSMKAVGIVDLDGQLSAGGFLPIRTVHDSAGINYFAAGIGGIVKEREHFNARVMGLFDLSAITRRIENGWPWWSSHVEKLTLPDFWLGPNLILPMPGDSVTWRDFGNVRTWTGYLGASVAIGW